MEALDRASAPRRATASGADAAEGSHAPLVADAMSSELTAAGALYAAIERLLVACGADAWLPHPDVLVADSAARPDEEVLQHGPEVKLHKSIRIALEATVQPLWQLGFCDGIARALSVALRHRDMPLAGAPPSPLVPRGDIMSPARFQLAHMGADMSRSVRAAPDPRVAGFHQTSGSGSCST